MSHEDWVASIVIAGGIALTIMLITNLLDRLAS